MPAAPQASSLPATASSAPRAESHLERQNLETDLFRQWRMPIMACAHSLIKTEQQRHQCAEVAVCASFSAFFVILIVCATDFFGM